MKKFLVLFLAAVMLCGAAAFPASAEDPVTISIYLQMPSDFVPEDNLFVEQIEKACNIKIEWQMPPINSYTESLNLMVADGNYPDIIQFPGKSNPGYLSCLESEVLIPLDDLLPNYENLINYVDPTSYTALRDTAPDGKLYGIARNTIVRQDGFLVRKDWMDNVGIEMPENGIMTKQEFYDLLYAFTYKDPDGNGQNDTYGLIDNCTNGELYPFITYAFGVNGWQKHEGESEWEYMSEIYCQEHDSYKQALAYTAKLWQDGLIDPVWPNTIGNAFRDRFYTGNAGVARFFGGWINTYENELKKNFPDAEVVYLVGVSNDEGECKAVSTFAGNIYSFYSLSINAEGKEDACLRMFDYLLSDEGWDLMNYGVKGVSYDVDAEGNKYALEGYDEYTKCRSYVTLLRRYTDPDYFINISCTPEQVEFARDAINKAVAITLPSVDLGYAPESGQTTQMLELNSEIAIVRSKIITGDLGLDAWDEVIAKWWAQGGEQVAKDMNEYIKNLNQ